MLGLGLSRFLPPNVRAALTSLVTDVVSGRLGANPRTRARVFRSWLPWLVLRPPVQVVKEAVFDLQSRRLRISGWILHERAPHISLRDLTTGEVITRTTDRLPEVETALAQSDGIFVHYGFEIGGVISPRTPPTMR
ncbi:MAG: hypothetical protein NVV72_12210 [Asticcacaulis sp.]|nr:hypothetical protein [Asticcacaulis sp.]